ncbi:hypothetical protein CI610_01922 [invertebrate metagenome]|uniref:TIGR02449 family protein n=1 Tax=invertebrate metagenome TaxID=1711999 RepID=A0A2H9T7D1_9ZZZZ
MKTTDFNILDRKISYLVRLCRQLQEDNRQLRISEAAWMDERAKLIEKNEMARDKVEAMIDRLRTLEHES